MGNYPDDLVQEWRKPTLTYKGVPISHEELPSGIHSGEEPVEGAEEGVYPSAVGSARPSSSPDTACNCGAGDWSEHKDSCPIMQAARGAHKRNLVGSIAEEPDIYQTLDEAQLHAKNGQAIVAGEGGFRVFDREVINEFKDDPDREHGPLTGLGDDVQKQHYMPDTPEREGPTLNSCLAGWQREKISELVAMQKEADYRERENIPMIIKPGKTQWEHEMSYGACTRSDNEGFNKGVPALEKLAEEYDKKASTIRADIAVMPQGRYQLGLAALDEERGR